MPLTGQCRHMYGWSNTGKLLYWIIMDEGSVISYRCVHFTANGECALACTYQLTTKYLTIEKNPKQYIVPWNSASIDRFVITLCSQQGRAPMNYVFSSKRVLDYDSEVKYLFSNTGPIGLLNEFAPSRIFRLEDVFQKFALARHIGSE